MTNRAKAKGDRCLCGCGRRTSQRGYEYVRGHRPGVSIWDRIWAKANVTSSVDDCWIWTGSKGSGGYGQIWDETDKRLRPAHRVAYELVFEAIPHGLFACHKCDVRTCINPYHIFPGTPLDNSRDAVAKGRIAATRALGLRAANGRLTFEQVTEIRARFTPAPKVGRGWKSNAKQLADEFDITPQYVSQIARNVWRKSA